MSKNKKQVVLYLNISPGYFVVKHPDSGSHKSPRIYPFKDSCYDESFLAFSVEDGSWRGIYSKAFMEMYSSFDKRYDRENRYVDEGNYTVFDALKNAVLDSE